MSRGKKSLKNFCSNELNAGPANVFRNWYLPFLISCQPSQAESLLSDGKAPLIPVSFSAEHPDCGSSSLQKISKYKYLEILLSAR